MPQLVPPVPFDDEITSESWNQFHEILRRLTNTPVYFAQATDPGTAGVPSGTWGVWLNTTSGVLKLWANQSGVMKSVTLT